MKSDNQVQRLRWLRHSHLCEIADSAEKWNYNRQLCSNAVRTLSSDARFPLLGWFEHNHRMMKPCEPHIRLLISLGPGHGMAIADVPYEFFYALPIAHVISKDERFMASVLLDEQGTPENIGFPNGDREARQALRTIAAMEGSKVQSFVRRFLRKVDCL